MVKDAFSHEHLFSQHSDRIESSMGDAERVEWQRLANALRRCIDATTTLAGDAGALASLSRRAEDLADEMATLSGARGVALFGGGAESAAGAISAGVPFSPVMGQLNPIAPPLVLHRDGDTVTGTVTLGSPYQGAPGLVHGAIVAAIYDEVLALANMLNGPSGPTARLSVQFRKPTPLHTPLRFEARTDRVDDRKVVAKGRCLAGDVVVSEAEGLYIRIRLPE